MIDPDVLLLPFDCVFKCSVMLLLISFFVWAFTCFAFSLELLDEIWSLYDSSFHSEQDLSESEWTLSMSTTYSHEDLFTDITVPVENELVDLEELPLLDEYPLEDEWALGSTTSETTSDWVADCDDTLQWIDKRRDKRQAKRGASCKAPSTGTETKPGGSGPNNPGSGGHPSFFPGYNEYILDPESNLLRIPGYVPSKDGENDICLIYTEGYMPYGVCGIEKFRFKSAATFYNQVTFTVTNAVLGM
jgi:hypothetical protein